MKGLLSIIFSLLFSAFICSDLYSQNKVGERRVYYLDATYSMVKPSKLWDPVRDDLEKAIRAIEDPNTEIYVIAFGGNRGEELKTWHGYATEEDKAQIINGFQSFQPQNNTMTYLERPLRDFYNGRVSPNKVTYCFLMTDGKDEDKPNVFYNRLREWGGKYGNANVYGFYVMLNKAAKDDSVDKIIADQEHLWKVESANVNINLIRLDHQASFNVRSDKAIEIPITGKTNGLSFNASFTQNSELKVKGCSIADGKLVIKVDVLGEPSNMPEFTNQVLNISMNSGGRFDFLVTDKIRVKCINKKEYILRSPACIQQIGKVQHYDGFGFVPASITPAKHTIEFEFNDDANNEKSTYAVFKFVDRKGNPINPSHMIVKVNGKPLKNNSFKITPTDHKADLEISFSDDAKRGLHKGKLLLVDSNLHRIDNDDCAAGNICICPWSVQNRKCMNPLACILLWLGIIIVSTLFVWFTILKPQRYPRFKQFRKSVIVKKNNVVVSNFNTNFKGAREVWFANKEVKQSAFNRLFTGKIVTIVNSHFEDPIKFVARKKGKKAMCIGKGYTFNPNPIMQSGIATIIEPIKKLTVILN